MARRILARSLIYEFLGRLLLSAGIMLGSLLFIRIIREEIEQAVALRSNYLIIPSTPLFELPPATPLPTFTPTPLPTAAPIPLPAIRLSIPSINLNTTITEIFPTETSSNGDIIYVWSPPAYAVGHYNSSGNPGAGQNIVLFGHNNIDGEVFRYLDRLVPGDDVILFTEEGQFNYFVQKKFMVPYFSVEEEGNAQLKSFAAPKPSEMVTLISCWPYATNSHRIVIVAVPLSGGD